MRSEAEIRKALARAEHGLATMEKLDAPLGTKAMVRCKIDILKWLLGNDGTATGLTEKFADEIDFAKTSHSRT